MRKIAVVTGARAEYGPLKPVMDAIEKDKELELIPIITGMHFLPDYGNTYKLVERDFPKSKRVPMDLEGDNLEDMVKYLSNGIINFAKYLSKNPPDIVIVAGDRSEPLAVALACLYLNIPVAHINGGDISGGTIDESIRHAITKIAHIHFAHTESNAERIKKMGEEEERIYVTGAPAIEAILKAEPKTRDELFKNYNLNPDKTTFLVVQHPITTLKDRGYSEMKELFLSLDILKKQTLLLYPNCDAGSKKFIDIIKEYENREYLHVFKNLPHKDYINFMKSVDVMIGNSSGGIIEAPTLKIPVINIGYRQKGRERSDNIIDVKPKKDMILDAVNFVLTDRVFRNKVKNCINKFGKGNASQKIVRILKQLKSDDRLLQKQITY